MKTILLFGAGESATVLIDYLLENAIAENWSVIVVDADIKLAQSKIGGSVNARAVSFDINNSRETTKYIRSADIVISLLPPHLNIEVAKECLRQQKNLLTASYVDEEIKKLQPAVSLPETENV